jgi:hypothetical protein
MSFRNVAALGLFLSLAAFAQQHEIGLTLGRLLEKERTGGSVRLTVGSGTALQANYGFRFLDAGAVAIYAEVHMLANPLRDISSPLSSVTRDVATIFVTPGVRIRFLPHSAASPYVVAGGGVAIFEQSTSVLGGSPNPAPRGTTRGVFDFGGGVDFPLWRFLGLRAEVRDFYSGSPSFNVSSIRGGHHNVVAGGGFVLKF